MALVTWTPIAIQPVQAGAIHVPWLKLVDTIRSATHLMITATGGWNALPGLLAPCEPDGLAGLVLPAERVVLPDAPPGALIGRIGGSSAGLKAEARSLAVRAAWSRCRPAASARYMSASTSRRGRLM